MTSKEAVKYLIAPIATSTKPSAEYLKQKEAYELAIKVLEERPQGDWGKWIIAEIQCPNCFEYFDTDCYSKGELNKCPNCGADMGGTQCQV